MALKTAFLAGIALSGLVAVSARAAEPADLVLTNARIVTEDALRPTAQALAVRDGRIVYVGDAQGAQGYV
ncbi:hypothetical protein, partial [Enterococcus faecalis]|uniref:hypothetical protein n=1 Tax=Enterococcus faecalis TaxID=1351 RepID=UPI00403F63E3